VRERRAFSHRWAMLGGSTFEAMHVDIAAHLVGIPATEMRKLVVSMLWYGKWCSRAAITITFYPENSPHLQNWNCK
jgi:hypothetical protein